MRLVIVFYELPYFVHAVWRMSQSERGVSEIKTTHTCDHAGSRIKGVASVYFWVKRRTHGVAEPVFLF